MTGKQGASARTEAPKESARQPVPASIVRPGDDMGKEPGTGLALLEDYERQGGYNVLHPIVQVQAGMASPVLVASVSVRLLKPDAGDTYNDFRFANERDGKHALSGLALGKISSDAGIRWVEPCVVEERTRDRATRHLYIRVRATGAVLQPNGEPYLISAHKEIDTADVEEQLEEQYLRKLRAGRAKYSERDVPEMVKRDIHQLREHLLSVAETKAQNRVIRKLLSLKQVYTSQELHRPFVVPRLLYRPDLTDPMAIERVQMQGSRAVAELYGSSSITREDEPSGEPSPDSESGAPGATAPQQAPTPASGVPESEASGATSEKSSGGEAKSAAPGSGAGVTPPEQPSPDYIPGVDGPAEPKDNPVFEGEGKHHGRRVKDIAQDDVSFLKGVVAQMRPGKRRDVYQAWIAWQEPSLG